MRSWKRNSLMTVLLSLMLSVVVFSIWMAGCAKNEPFDPNSLENAIPVAELFVTSAEDEDLNTTSYFERIFNWSGSDRDGFVEEFYVSIRTDGENPAPWDTTTATDTTMTFLPDPSTGEASATFLLACKDNRGAYSDTLVQFFPMRNHPPVVEFEPDFDPLQNMQREFVYEGEAVVDTVYYNWGASNFRFLAYDLDGVQTMNDFYRYTFVDGGNPDQTWDHDHPDADPELGWVKVAFEVGTESYEFELFITDLSPGEKTLTVSVQDEAQGDPRFQYTWEVRAPKSPVLYIADNSSSVGRAMYGDLLDGMFGEDNWDQYDFVFGFPDKPFVLLENMRQFDAVIWTDGGTMSDVLSRASATDGVLHQYVLPQDNREPGRLLLVSKIVAGYGSDGTSIAFGSNVLGINASAGLPEGILENFGGRSTESQGGANYLPGFTGLYSIGQGTGLNIIYDMPNEPDHVPSEELYRMEFCVRCYGPPGQPFDPVIAIRRPHRDVDPVATVVCFALQLEYFNNSQVVTALEQVLTDEMGVVAK